MVLSTITSTLIILVTLSASKDVVTRASNGTSHSSFVMISNSTSSTSSSSTSPNSAGSGNTSSASTNTYAHTQNTSSRGTAVSGPGTCSSASTTSSTSKSTGSDNSSTSLAGTSTFTPSLTSISTPTQNTSSRGTTTPGQGTSSSASTTSSTSKSTGSDNSSTSLAGTSTFTPSLTSISTPTQNTSSRGTAASGPGTSSSASTTSSTSKSTGSDNSSTSLAGTSTFTPSLTSISTLTQNTSSRGTTTPGQGTSSSASTTSSTSKSTGSDNSSTSLAGTSTFTPSLTNISTPTQNTSSRGTTTPGQGASSSASTTSSTSKSTGSDNSSTSLAGTSTFTPSLTNISTPTQNTSSKTHFSSVSTSTPNTSLTNIPAHGSASKGTNASGSGTSNSPSTAAARSPASNLAVTGSPGTSSAGSGSTVPSSVETDTSASSSASPGRPDITSSNTGPIDLITVSGPTPPPPFATPNIKSAHFDVEFSLKVNLNFSEDLYNKTSMEFKNYSTVFRNKLEEAYKDIAGFLRIEIIGFLPGSIIANYTVVFDVTDTPSNVTSYIQNTMMTLTNGRMGGEVDSTFINDTMPRDIKIAESMMESWCGANGICPVGYKCHDNKTKITCSSKCMDYTCNNRGVCQFDKNGEPFCKCNSHPKYVYGGSHCETKGEQLPLQSDYIYAIAGGAGGGLILIFIFVLICVFGKRHKSNKLTRDGELEARDKNLPHLSANGSYVRGPGVVGYDGQSNSLNYKATDDPAYEMVSVDQRERTQSNSDDITPYTVYQPSNVSQPRVTASADLATMMDDGSVNHIYAKPIKMRSFNPHESGNPKEQPIYRSSDPHRHSTGNPTTRWSGNPTRHSSEDIVGVRDGRILDEVRRHDQQRERDHQERLEIRNESLGSIQQVGSDSGFGQYGDRAGGENHGREYKRGLIGSQDNDAYKSPDRHNEHELRNYYPDADGVPRSDVHGFNHNGNALRGADKYPKARDDRFISTGRAEREGSGRYDKTIPVYNIPVEREAGDRHHRAPPSPRPHQKLVGHLREADDRHYRDTPSPRPQQKLDGHLRDADDRHYRDSPSLRPQHKMIGQLRHPDSFIEPKDVPDVREGNRFIKIPEEDYDTNHDQYSHSESPFDRRQGDSIRREREPDSRKDGRREYNVNEGPLAKDLQRRRLEMSRRNQQQEESRRARSHDVRDSPLVDRRDRRSRDRNNDYESRPSNRFNNPPVHSGDVTFF